MRNVYYAGMLCVFMLLSIPVMAQAPDIEIGNGTATVGLPINTNYQYSYSQTIFLQEELDIEGKRIHKLAFYYQGGRMAEEQVRIYMRHTEQTTLSGYITDGLTKVYEGPFPLMNQEGWAEIALTTPFEYNNQDNLLIAMTEDKPGFIINSVFNSTAVADNKSVLAIKDLSPAYDPYEEPPSFSVLGFRPNIRMWFEDIPQGPALSAMPSQLYYMYIREQEEKSFNVLVTNTGTEPLEITGLNSYGLPFHTNYTGSIAPGQTQPVDIRFQPQQTGVFKGFVTLESNSSLEPLHIYVEGFAVNAQSVIETFQETTFPPEQWTVEPNSWTRRGFGGFIGGGNAYLNTGTDPGKLITPKLNIQPGDEIVFYASEQLDGILTVSHSFDMENWTELETIQLTRSYLRYIIDLEDFQGQGYIGFSGIPRIYLDYVIAPPIYADVAPSPATNPGPADDFEDAFVTQVLTWSASALADGYKVYVGTDNPPTNLVDGQDVGAHRSFKTPVLEYNTEYFWKVVPYNQHGDATDSPVWSFTTITYNPVVEFPFEEGFEKNDGQVPPAGWINQDGHWLKTSTSVNSGQYAARVLYSHIGDAILITPPLQMGNMEDLELIFYWKNGNITGKDGNEKIIGHDTLYVEVTADYGQNWAVKGIYSAAQPMTAFAPVNVDLAEFSGEEIYIRFRHSTNNQVNYAKPVAIDDITVQGAMTEPVLWINNEDWDAGSIANETFLFSDEFRIRNMGASLLTITSVDFDGDQFTTTFEAEDVELAFGEEYVFTFGFEPFDVGDFSATMTLETNGGTVEINMTGASEAVTPFTFEGFEDGLVPPHGWMNHSLGEEGSGWMRAWNHAQPAHSGTFSAISFSYVPGWGDMQPDNWLVTSRIQVQEDQEFIFWVATGDATYYAEHYTVYVSTTTNRLDQFTHVLHDETLKPIHVEWSPRIFDLTAWAGQDIYIAFRHHESVGNFLIKLDDIEIRDILVVETPYADPPAGAVAAGTAVSLLTDTQGASIYYTLDGSDPDAGSLLFESPVTINHPTTIKAIAWKEGTFSDVATFEYTVDNTSVPLLNPALLKVYPNPATDRLWIDNATGNPLEATLFDVFGAAVRTQAITGQQASMDLGGLSAGVYFLRIHDGEKLFQQKIVIQ
jgi:hypothetical protein